MSSVRRNSEHNPSVDRTIAELARRNEGVIAYEDACRNGITKHQLQRRSSAGVIIRRYPRVYVAAGSPRTPLQDLAAVFAWAGADAVFSGRTAAAFWQLHGFPLGPPYELSVARYMRSCSRDIQVHRVKAWGRGDVCRKGRWRLTTPARTLIDLAAVLPNHALRDVLDEILIRDLCTSSRLKRRLDDSGRQGRPGSGSLLALLDEFDGSDLLPRSVLESRYIRASIKAGLPKPAPQWPVEAQGKRYSIDFAYPTFMLAIELDGWRFHGTRRAWEADIDRSNALVASNWRVIRGTWRSVQKDPDSLLDRVAAILKPALSV